MSRCPSCSQESALEADGRSRQRATGTEGVCPECGALQPTAVAEAKEVEALRTRPFTAGSRLEAAKNLVRGGRKPPSSDEAGHAETKREPSLHQETFWTTLERQDLEWTGDDSAQDEVESESVASLGPKGPSEPDREDAPFAPKMAQIPSPEGPVTKAWSVAPEASAPAPSAAVRASVSVATTTKAWTPSKVNQMSSRSESQAAPVNVTAKTQTWSPDAQRAGVGGRLSEQSGGVRPRELPVDAAAASGSETMSWRAAPDASAEASHGGQESASDSSAQLGVLQAHSDSSADLTIQAMPEETSSAPDVYDLALEQPRPEQPAPLTPAVLAALEGASEREFLDDDGASSLQSLEEEQAHSIAREAKAFKGTHIREGTVTYVDATRRGFRRDASGGGAESGRGQQSAKVVGLLLVLAIIVLVIVLVTR